MTFLFECSLDDDVWDIRFHFCGVDYLERTLTKSAITVLNLLALLEEHGYGIRDSMYYVKEKGKGKSGMQVIETMKDVKNMLSLYDKEKIVNITVLKKNDSWPVEVNMEDVELSQFNEPALLSINVDGVTYMSEGGKCFLYIIHRSFLWTLMR